MKSDNIISIKNISKTFSVQKQKTVKELIQAILFGQSTSHTFKALSNIDFTIQRGESFGVIGPNGSGKSTLLKLLAGVTTPDTGKITVLGKVAPLIELGAGFHPELSGRENIYLNGVILGMKKTEISQIVDQIIDFSELIDFIDQPIKHYSSGMYLRLAFAVAIHTNPDILLIDEILAVGDAQFKIKSRQRMDELKQQGKTIVLISHSMNDVLDFCDRAAYLDKGHLVVVGDVRKVVGQYQAKISI